MPDSKLPVRDLLLLVEGQERVHVRLGRRTAIGPAREGRENVARAGRLFRRRLRPAHEQALAARRLADAHRVVRPGDDHAREVRGRRVAVLHADEDVVRARRRPAYQVFVRRWLLWRNATPIVCGPAFTASENSRRMSGVIRTRSSSGSAGAGFSGCEPGAWRMKNIGTSSSLNSLTRRPFSVTSSSSPSAPSPKTWPKLSFRSESRIWYSPSVGKLCVTDRAAARAERLAVQGLVLAQIASDRVGHLAGRGVAFADGEPADLGRRGNVALEQRRARRRARRRCCRSRGSSRPRAGGPTRPPRARAGRGSRSRTQHGSCDGAARVPDWGWPPPRDRPPSRCCRRRRRAPRAPAAWRRRVASVRRAPCGPLSPASRRPRRRGRARACSSDRPAVFRRSLWHVTQ